MSAASELNFDFSELKLSDQQKEDVLIKLMSNGYAGIRSWIMKVNKVPGRTKINKLFQRGYGRLKEIQKLQDDDPTLNYHAASIAYDNKRLKEQQECVKMVLKHVDIYQYINEVFMEKPEYILRVIERTTSIVPDGLKIDLTSKPSWL